MAEVAAETETLSEEEKDEKQLGKSDRTPPTMQNGHLPSVIGDETAQDQDTRETNLEEGEDERNPRKNYTEPTIQNGHLPSTIADAALQSIDLHEMTLGDMSDDEGKDDTSEWVGPELDQECQHEDCHRDDVDYEDDMEDVPYPGLTLHRKANPDIPSETVTVLETEDGGKVYVVGTAHFSHSSQEDVAQTIRETVPDVVLVELCSSRVNILQLDEATLLEEAKNINFDKVRAAIKQSGMVQGIMHLLLLSMSAHLTKQLGMAPGGEFRRAFQEAQLIQGCRVHLGDRPIQVTLRRALGALTLWQKLRLAWYMITSKEPISAEEVERCKQRDLLEEMLREMTGEFPALSHVFVTERDMFLANSLRLAARPLHSHLDHEDQVPSFTPAVVVGVVGIGHVPGIVENWNKQNNIKELMTLPPSSALGGVIRWTSRALVIGALSWAGYKLLRLTSDVIIFTYHNVPLKLAIK